MNEELKKMLDSINAKKQEVKDLCKAGKIEDAATAKEELKKLQAQFDLVYDLDVTKTEGMGEKAAAGAAKTIADKAKNIAGAFVNAIKAAVGKGELSTEDKEIEDISVALGVMANAGIKGSTAGTTLKNVIANMAKPTDAQAAVMQKLGISLTDSSGNMKSFAEVMNNLRSSFNGLSETEKASYATTLAGKESMSGLLTIVNASAADFDKLTEAINGSSGSAEAMAAKMLDNLKGQLTLLKSAVEGIAITIGDKLLPYLKKFVSWVQKAADYINNLSDAQVDSIMKWAAIAAAIPPIIMVFGKVVTMVGTVQRTFGTITKTIANFGGIIGTITSPAGIVIGVRLYFFAQKKEAHDERNFYCCKGSGNTDTKRGRVERIGNFYSDRSGIWKNPGYFNFVYGGGST